MLFHLLFKLSRKYYVFYCILRCFFSCDIGMNVKMGNNVNFSHDALGVVIHNDSKIGNNVWIEHHVCIGQKTAKVEAPTIEDDCVIGAYAIILGNVHIGKRCVIGAGSIVTHDIPDNTIFYNRKIDCCKTNYKETGNY